MLSHRGVSPSWITPLALLINDMKASSQNQAPPRLRRVSAASPPLPSKGTLSAKPNATKTSLSHPKSPTINHPTLSVLTCEYYMLIHISLYNAKKPRYIEFKPKQTKGPKGTKPLTACTFHIFLLVFHPVLPVQRSPGSCTGPRPLPVVPPERPRTMTYFCSAVRSRPDMKSTSAPSHRTGHVRSV